jgi:hypothetical protein
VVTVASIAPLCAEDHWEEYGKTVTKAIVASSVVLFVSLLIPSKETIIQMIVADNTTPANLIKAKDLGLDLKDGIKKDVLEIIREINKEGEDE